MSPLLRRAALRALVGAAGAIATAGAGTARAEASEEAALRAFDQLLPRWRRAAPDYVVDRMRRRATALLAPLPGFDPGTLLVDRMVERPWPTLRQRCRAQARDALSGQEALALARDVLAEGDAFGRASAEDWGGLAAMITALDGRLCACAAKPSLALAADCAG